MLGSIYVLTGCVYDLKALKDYIVSRRSFDFSRRVMFEVLDLCLKFSENGCN